MTIWNSYVNNNWNYIIPVISIAYRISIANHMPIMDCDEVFNYWEPLHFLLYEYGKQTWEYSSLFALRTYAYLIFPNYILVTIYQWFIHYNIIPAFLMNLFIHYCSSSSSSSITKTNESSDGSNPVNTKLFLFYMLRCTIGGFCAFCEYQFCKSIYNLQESPPTTLIGTTANNKIKKKTDNNNENNKNGDIAGEKIVGIITYVLLTLSAGMSHASQSFLPSSTCMILYMIGATCLCKQFTSINNQNKKNINNVNDSKEKKNNDYYYHYYYGFIAIAVYATLGVGWPFIVVLFVPLGIYTLLSPSTQTSSNKNHVFYRHLYGIARFTIAITLLIQSTICAIDYYYYKKLTLPNWNIFVYNTGAGGNGDELYGVEPISYYIKNLLLNFNFVLILAIPALFILLIRIFLPLQRNQSIDLNQSTTTATTTTLFLALVIPMYIWLQILILRPHKEERFLFPIYPILCLSAAITMHYGVYEIIMKWILAKANILSSSTTKLNAAAAATTVTTCVDDTTKTTSSAMIMMIFHLVWIIPYGILCSLRIMALSKYYTAPLYVYAYLSNYYFAITTGTTHGDDTNNYDSSPGTPALVCTCGEWYRFPSSFYLPSSSSSSLVSKKVPSLQLAFLKSSFDGQLPLDFQQWGSAAASTTGNNNNDLDENEIIINQFNDQNKPAPNQIVESTNDCMFVIDLQGSNDDMCSSSSSSSTTTAATNQNNFELLHQWPFLDIDQTPFLHRILYIPYIHKNNVKYKNYVLYRNNNYEG